ncbi:GntR family transcriptional regulator [Xaviernesmea oryzae]|uniref:GntR family transcriptional regulator, vanillate catabolism transcriptional regulator n=1 Tax=Xaviernesmea oryzae TaxID=464029 RepID=A0A1X7DBI8_9HYPH|nr:GntR family transcriptional regulator [Xaviernesmea oryzae]SMF12060.1 GntR family transcriptional regulator, vanillate catabolism transcriptional regulator [Xaviernesmea oryzae]
MVPFERVPTGDERQESRQKHVIDTLRAWVVDGKIGPDEKLSEASLAEALGVSRTPIRTALAILVEEGVLERTGPRGYRVRTYKVAEVKEAIELRSIIEAYAAKRIAAAGPSPKLVADLKACLLEGDEIFSSNADPQEREARYARMNARFHGLILEAAGVSIVPQIISLLDRVPFGAPGAIRFDDIAKSDRIQHLHQAHWQHHHMVLALIARDVSRVGRLFQEHGEGVKISLGLSPGPFNLGPSRLLPIVDPGAGATNIDEFLQDKDKQS